MGIKSLEELKNLRDKYKADLVGRDYGASEDRVRVTVGMATCGIASGARDTINAIIEEVKNQNMNNVIVVQSGCMGYCYAEPTVEVRKPGRAPVLYGKIDGEKGREIVRKHLINDNILTEFEIKR